MTKPVIGVICGGQSAEHEISLLSAYAILSHFDHSRYTLLLIGINSIGQWHLYNTMTFLAQAANAATICLPQPEVGLALIPQDPSPIRKIDNLQPVDIDVLFPIVHGSFGEDGNLQGLLTHLGLPFVGSAVLGSAICMDKDISKRLLRDANIAIAPFVTIRAKEDLAQIAEKIAHLGWPLYVKPANQGSSVGVSRVTNPIDLKAAINEARQYDEKILIEKAIAGREIECAILGNLAPKASLCGEIKVVNQYYSYASKYLEANSAQLTIPAQLNPQQMQRIQAIALQTYQLLECRGLARIDVFLTADEQIIVNEVNTLPGFTAISMYPQLWQVSGLSYSLLLEQLIELAQQHYQCRGQLKHQRT